MGGGEAQGDQQLVVKEQLKAQIRKCQWPYLQRGWQHNCSSGGSVSAATLASAVAVVATVAIEAAALSWLLFWL